MKDSNKKRIAFIYEGVQAEENLLANMKRVYLSEFYEVETFQLPADGNIYMLWKGGGNTWMCACRIFSSLCICERRVCLFIYADLLFRA